MVHILQSEFQVSLSCIVEINETDEFKVAINSYQNMKFATQYVCAGVGVYALMVGQAYNDAYISCNIPGFSTVFWAHFLS